MKNKYLLSLNIVALLMFLPIAMYAQSVDASQEDFTTTTETELVIEDFETTGLGDSTSFGIAIGGLFGGSAMLDMNFDFYVSPLVAIRLSLAAAMPFDAGLVAAELGLGAIWRSYVINRVRFYGGVLLKGSVDFIRDFDILLVPEGMGGFEIYASPTVSIYTEFGGRTAIALFDLNGTAVRQKYEYADGFFFRVGTRFDL